MNEFDAALRFTLLREGGVVDDPRDFGGLTRSGLTQPLYDRLRTERGQPTRAVSQATDAEVSAVAYSYFWLPARCDELAWPASAALFDSAYMMGADHARQLLQAVLGVAVDGTIGATTVTEADRRVASHLAHDLVSARRGYHLKATIDRPDQRVFLKGWLARCDKLDAFIAKVGAVE